MSKIRTQLLNSTALIPVHWVKAHERPVPSSNARGTVINGCSMEGCGVGIMIAQRHVGPEVSFEVLAELDDSGTSYVTRHIEEKYLEDALKGYFRLGTLINYRADETQKSGRLGDHQESRQHEVFNSRSEFFKNADFGDLSVQDTAIRGTDRQVVIETVVNDFCSCCSIGEFEHERALKIRENEDDDEKKPTAFVTYDLSKLKDAIQKQIKDRAEYQNFQLFGRPVEYGEKDKLWEVEEHFAYRKDKDGIAIWLGISFIKSPIFAHEEEFRILLTNPTQPGGLADGTDTFIIESDDDIAAAIVAHGKF